MARILFDNASVSFTVRRHGRIPLKDFLVHGLFRRRVNPRLTVEALNRVSFDVADGDRLGVIGHNGAGKSTLLKTIAGVYCPTAGRVVVEGRIASLFDIMLGFEPDASGWENIYFRSYLQGETPRTIAPRVKAIAEFSELGEYLDMSVRYLSTGMAVRLGFAIATSIDPQILIVDEILGAGDMAFQEKARRRINAMISKAHLAVIASHDLQAIKSLCNRVIWMDHGHAKMFGPTDEVVAAYTANLNPTLSQAA